MGEVGDVVDGDLGRVALPGRKLAAEESIRSGPPSKVVVVVGDADFASNYLVAFQGNGDLFMNMVNWTAQQENLIAIRPKDPQDRRITLTEGQRSSIFYLTLIIIPGLFLVAGIATWWRRR